MARRPPATSRPRDRRLTSLSKAAIAPHRTRSASWATGWVGHRLWSLTLDHQQARCAIRTGRSGGFLTLSCLGTAARAPGRRSKCPRRRTDGTDGRFPCVAPRHKLPHNDGINNTHDGDESGPNKPYRWLITSQDCNRIAKNRGWYHYEANRHCNGGSAARMREGAPGCRWKV